MHRSPVLSLRHLQVDYAPDSCSRSSFPRRTVSHSESAQSSEQGSFSTNMTTCLGTFTLSNPACNKRVYDTGQTIDYTTTSTSLIQALCVIRTISRPLFLRPKSTSNVAADLKLFQLLLLDSPAPFIPVSPFCPDLILPPTRLVALPSAFWPVVVFCYYTLPVSSLVGEILARRVNIA